MINVKNAEETSLRLEAVRLMRQIIDPELGVNIVDLRLIYQIYLQDETFVVIYTTTTPGCPLRRYLQRMIEDALQSMEGIGSFEAKMVLDPQWTVDMIKAGVEFFSVPPPMVSG